MMLYLQLFYAFFRTGLFAIGGGLATVPFLNTLADNTGWYTRLDLLNMIAVSESTPGAIGVNMATYVGYTVAGIPGCIIATLGLVTPSVIVILIVAHFLRRFSEHKIVKAAMFGLRACSAALITAAGLSIAKEVLVHWEALPANLPSFFNLKAIVLFAVLIYATNCKQLKKLHPIAFLGASAVVGVVLHFAGV